MALVLCALGAYFTVQLIKFTVVPRTLQAVTKVVLALLVSFGISAAIYEPKHPRDMVIYALAGAGLASIVHKLVRFLTVEGDWKIREMQRNRRAG